MRHVMGAVIIVSSVQVLGLNVLGEFDLPSISVVKELLLVVQQLLVRLGRVLKVRAFDNRIHRACLLAKAAVDALCHVNIVTGGPPGTVLTRLCLNGNSLRWANGLTQLARNAPLLPRRISEVTPCTSTSRLEHGMCVTMRLKTRRHGSKRRRGVQGVGGMLSV